MSSSIDIWADRLLESEAIHELEGILGRQLRPEHLKAIKAAATLFQMAAIEETFLPGRSKRRKDLLTFASRLDDLGDSLESTTLLYFGRDFAAHLPKGQELRQLSEAVHQSAATIPQAGADPKKARYELIVKLADLYEKVTGRVPRRSVNPASGMDIGNFLEFVRAIFRRVDPRELEPDVKTSALKGLEAEVRKVLEERNSGASPS